MRSLLLDLAPLRKHRDFRLLFIGQWVIAFGSFMTYVALPVLMANALLPHPSERRRAVRHRRVHGHQRSLCLVTSNSRLTGEGP